MMTETVVVMAVFDPDIDVLRDQFASLDTQYYQDFSVVAVIADLASHDLVTQAIAGTNLQVEITTPDTALSAPQAFEFGLAVAIKGFPSAQFFAFCDQDDLWTRNRLSHCRQALIGAGTDLVHSDATLIDQNGYETHRSLFATEGRLENPTPRDLLYRNTVTGMTTFFTRNLVERALPFPAQDGVHFYHDLWLALLARTGAGITFVKQPLVKYRQHSKNAVGARPVAPAATTGVALLKQRTAAYGLARYLAETAMARGVHHPQLAPFLQSRSWGGAFWWDAIWLGVRGHFSLAHIAAWFAVITLGRRVWALHRTLKPGYRIAQMEFDNHMFALSPGMHPPQPKDVEKRAPARSWWTYFDGRMTADWSVKLTASTPAVVILVPSLNPAEMFAGLATALDIGIGLAQRGHNVRFVATDAPMINHAASQHFIRARGGPIERVELHCGITQGTIPFHPDDRIMATAWWTAHLAKSVLQNPKFRHRQFLYLIQDYEPCFYPWGTEYACARASYKFDHIPIFNSAPLRDYFKLRGYDVGHDPLCFHPAIDVDRYAAQIRPDKPRRKIAIYGRPEVSRNLFEMGIGALGHWIERDGITPDTAELVSVGMIHPDVELPNGMVLRSAGKLPWAEYPAFLATVDVGLALMCSPHPSHLPIELAAAGAHVVTNGFDCKDLSLLSPMIISTELCEPDLVVGLSKAWSSKRQPTPIDLTLIGDPIDVMLDRLAALLDPAVQLAAE